MTEVINETGAEATGNSRNNRFVPSARGDAAADNAANSSGGELNANSILDRRNPVHAGMGGRNSDPAVGVVAGDRGSVAHALRRETEAARTLLASMADVLGDDSDLAAIYLEHTTDAGFEHSPMAPGSYLHRHLAPQIAAAPPDHIEYQRDRPQWWRMAAEFEQRLFLTATGRDAGLAEPAVLEAAQ